MSPIHLNILNKWADEAFLFSESPIADFWNIVANNFII